MSLNLPALPKPNRVFGLMDLIKVYASHMMLGEKNGPVGNHGNAAGLELYSKMIFGRRLLLSAKTM
ncbi:MAG: hypothetical protein GX119_09070 [Syntrophomonadaceae bacterium]|jgi:hypothetical protein|nr:hypothetical protein [Syntrophomonadaceae bacterium]